MTNPTYEGFSQINVVKTKLKNRQGAVRNEQAKKYETTS